MFACMTHMYVCVRAYMRVCACVRIMYVCMSGLARLSRMLENSEFSRFLCLKYTESRRLRSDLQPHVVGLFVHDVMFCMSAHVLPCLPFDCRSHVICFCNVMHVLLHFRSSVKEKED